MKDFLPCFSVLVVPNAQQNKLVGLHRGVLKIALTAKPREGEANRALIVFLSELLGIPKTQILIKRGLRSKHKVIQLRVEDPEGVWQRVLQGIEHTV